MVVATGPTLTATDVELLWWSDARVIAVNDAGLAVRTPNVSWAPIWYSADSKFWVSFESFARASKALTVCGHRNVPDFVDVGLNLRDPERASRWEPGYAEKGEPSAHSGFQALWLAISLGASKVVLLGYDCRATGTQTNYFGRKEGKLAATSDYEKWPACYRREWPVDILNATPGSAIDAFPMRTLRDALW